VLTASRQNLIQITVDARTAVDAHALVLELLDLQGQCLVDLGPWRERLTPPSVIAAAVNLQNVANAREPEFQTVLPDECVLHPDCLAKYAAAFLNLLTHV
jgi:hypothetical protein